ncbi:hypothetical protein, partial [Cronobacter sakazakii]
PKRLKLALTHRKVQHRITFGCDVVVDGRVIKPVRPDDGPIFTLPSRVARRWNNGTWQALSITFENVFIVSAAGSAGQGGVMDIEYWPDDLRLGVKMANAMTPVKEVN